MSDALCYEVSPDGAGRGLFGLLDFWFHEGVRLPYGLDIFWFM